MLEIKIGKNLISNSRPAYIIAEVGLNHQGDIAIAKTLIDKAVEAGANCVKFQKRSLKDVYTTSVLENTEGEEHATHYILHHIQKTELSDDDMRELYSYTRKCGVDFLCTPWDEESLWFLDGLGVPAFKIASADMFNLKFLAKVAALKKPMLISTGMSFPSEIEQMADFLKKVGAEYILLHCNSTYPAPYHDINLNFLKVLRDKFSPIVGYSGHEQGISVSLAAVALGAKILERHITLDRTMDGPDHKASLHPDEFAELVKQVRIVESALGDENRFPSRGEYLNRETLSKSLVAAHNLRAGQILTADDIAIKSPGKGTNPLKFDSFVGQRLNRDIPKDGFLLESDINVRPRDLYGIPDIKHRWGVVARMSDIESMLPCEPGFIEIHLTGSDVVSKKKYSREYDIDVVFHGPEYDGDLLLNLSSTDEDIRKRSIAFFNAALEHARELKKLFRNKSEKAKFIVHPGGMDIDRPLLDQVVELNARFADSLSKLNGEGFELLLENMPGLAWYFGGQWHQSNFMDASEIVDFAKKYGYGVTFDTSHAALYCNHYGKDLIEYARTILPVTRYVHISDGAKANGEGLQIGDGTIDFKRLLDELTKTDLWFLPEIWQGHKFGGEGFLRAVHKLKSLHPDF